MIDDLLAEAFCESVDWHGTAVAEATVTRLPAHDAAAVRHAWTLLGREERVRAATFRLPSLRDRFVLRRATLRHLLAARLGRAPEDLAFARDARDKPFIEAAPLRFSVAYANDWMLLATSRDADVGCDLAHRDDAADAAALARVVLPAREAAWVRSHAGAGQARAFLHCWTLREAFGKAIGGGLLADLSELDTTVLAETATVRLASGTWCARTWEPGPFFQGAIVVALSEDGPMLLGLQAREQCNG